MKISAVPANQPVATINPDEGRSVSSERAARVLAKLTGATVTEHPDAAPVADPQVARAEASIKRIRMRTNQTPAPRELTQEAPPVENVAAAASAGNVSDQVESTPAATEATKPLSPQIAALMKRERAAQVKEAAIEAREKALAAKEAGTTPEPDLINRLKTDTLSLLEEHGVSYDQLTEQILARSQSQDPRVDKVLQSLSAIEKRFEDQTKSQADRDLAQRAQVVAQMGKDASALIAAKPEAYEMIRLTPGADKAIVRLIEQEFDANGNVLDVQEAADLIEADLLAEETRKLEASTKLKAKLTPPQPQPAQQNNRPIRTLTQRDGASVSLSRKERALLAARGQLNS